MRVKAVILENFRRFQRRTVIPIDRLTAFIGKNDAGKSTILEALDIFFEGDTVKIEPGDASRGGDPKSVRIGVVFTDLPAVPDLDRGARTTLSAEFLLNPTGDLEIHKIYNLAVSKPQAPKVLAVANHPTAAGLAGLLQKTNADLKTIVKNMGLEDQCKLNENPSMRHAIYTAAGDLKIATVEVPLNEGEGKDIWAAIQRHLPVYALFRSDRASSDQDPEVQNPMKLAIQKALADLGKELEEITTKVEQVAQETATRTIEQLRKSYPDLELASALKPQFRKPSWANVFKLDLESDDGIPLNKRGSGVRRLVLLSFFQAEAARTRRAREAAGQTGVPVIYAIEEPETSQHPDSQERIIRAFREVAEAGDQVLLTTHVPGLAGLLPLEGLRFLDADPATANIRVRAGTKEVFEEIAAALGVLPDASDKPGVKVAVVVEGPTDIDALVSLAAVLAGSGDVQALDHGKIFWTMGGGSTLKEWVERRYLDSLGLPQVYLFDSDRTAAELPPSREKEGRLTEINARPRCNGFMTRKRTIENYVHPDAIARATNANVALPAGIDLDFGNLAHAFGEALETARGVGNLAFYPTDHTGQQLALKKSNAKRIITAHIMRHMTADEIKGRSTYTDGQGTQRCEVVDWIQAISAHIAA